MLWLRLSLLTLCLAGAACAGLITIVDFESCTLAPLGTPCGEWTFANFAGVQSGAGASLSGNPGKNVRLETSGSALHDPTATATVAGLTIGADYTLQWDWALRVNFSGAANGPSFGVFLDTQTLATALFLGTRLVATYTTDSIVFTATSATHSFIFAGELDGRTNGAGTTDVSYKLDNVSLEAVAATVPEPRTYGLIGLGLLALGACRRRASLRPSK